MELGLMEGKYIDRKAQLAQMSPEERRWVEINRLRNLQRDSSQWGGWNFKLHVASVQKDRQYRAYGLAEENQAIDTLARRGVIHGYQTALEHCSCPDFEERILPCKHIYCLALLLGMQLALSYEDYLKQRKSFDEVT
jgi:hypothetical protein